MAYYVYMTASRRYGTLYLGVTNNLSHRIWQHKTKAHGVLGQVRRRPPRLVRVVRAYRGSDRAREGAQEVTAGLKDPADRGDEPRLAGSLPRSEPIVFMGSGLGPSARPGMTAGRSWISISPTNSGS